MPLTLQSMASMQHRIKTRSLIADLRDEFNQLACPGLGGARYSSYQGASSVQTRTCWAEPASPRPGPPTPRRGLSHSRPHSSQSGRGAHTHRPSVCPPLPPAQSAAVSGCLVAKERTLLVTLGRARDVHLAPCGPTSQSRDRSLREPLKQGSRGPQKPGSPHPVYPQDAGSPSHHGNWPWYPHSLTQGPVCMSPSSSHPQDGDAPEHFYSISSSFF